jgi:hypothetical protein
MMSNLQCGELHRTYAHANDSTALSSATTLQVLLR